MKYLIKANHPVLKRVDETVDEMEVGQRVAELLRLYYEIESIKSAQLTKQATVKPRPAPKPSRGRKVSS